MEHAKTITRSSYEKSNRLKKYSEVKELVLDTKTADILVQRYNSMLVFQFVVVLTRLLLLVAAGIKVLTMYPWSSLPRMWVEASFFFMVFNALHFFGIVIEGVSQLFGASVFGRKKWVLCADKVVLGRWYDLWSMLGVGYDCLLRCGLPLFILTGNGWQSAGIAGGIGLLQVVAILCSHGVCRGYDLDSNARWSKRFLRGLEFGFMVLSWVGLTSCVAVPSQTVGAVALVLAAGSSAVVGKVMELSSNLLVSLDRLDYGRRSFFWQSGFVDPVRSWSVQRDMDASRLVDYCTRGSMQCVGDGQAQKAGKMLLASKVSGIKLG